MNRIQLSRLAILILGLGATLPAMALQNCGYGEVQDRDLDEFYKMAVEAPTAWATLPDSTFRNLFSIYTDWDTGDTVTYPSPEDWPWPLSYFQEFSHGVMPDGPSDPMAESMAHRITSYFGEDTDGDYTGISLNGHTHFHIVVTAFDNDYPTADDSTVFLRAQNFENDVARMLKDSFAHEWQHLVDASLNVNQQCIFTGEYSELRSQGAEHIAGWYWWPVSPPVQGDNCDDLSFTRSITHADWWVSCFGPANRIHTYSVFAPYLVEHCDLPEEEDGSGEYGNFLYKWIRQPDTVYPDSLTRQDFDALADLIADDDYEDFFNSAVHNLDGSMRLAELFHNFALALWVNSDHIIEYPDDALIWADGASPQETNGYMRDWDYDCNGNQAAMVMYNHVASGMDSTFYGPLTPQHIDPECTGTVELPLHVNSYGYNILPFVADDSILESGVCHELELTIEIEDECLCQMQPDDTYEAAIDDNDKLQFTLFGYPESMEGLDTEGAEAVLLMHRAVHGDTLDFGDPISFTIPCFGSAYKSVVMVISLTEVAATSGSMYANILPFSYRFRAYEYDGESGSINSYIAWPDDAERSLNGNVCLDGYIFVNPGGTFSIKPGSTVWCADPDSVGGSVGIITQHTGNLMIGVYPTSSDLVTFKPVSDYGHPAGWLAVLNDATLRMDHVSWDGCNGISTITQQGYRPDIGIVDCDITMIDDANGIRFEYADPVTIEDSNFWESTTFQCGDNTSLNHVRIDVADDHNDAGMTLYGSTNLDEVRITNAYNGLNCIDDSDVTFNANGGDCTVQIEGRGRFTSGTAGLIVAENAEVEAQHCIIRDFERGLVVEDYGDVLFTYGEITDCIDGVYVPLSHADVDLGHSSPTTLLGNNCISSDITENGVRVYTRSKNPVKAVGNYWYTSSPTSSLFDGIVDWTSYQSSCVGTGGELNFFLGQSADNGNVAELGYGLFAPYPNPFNPRCSIRFVLPDSGEKAELAIYDVTGRKLLTLYSGLADGSELERVWSGSDAGGHDMSSGIYFARLTAGSLEDNAKLILIR